MPTPSPSMPSSRGHRFDLVPTPSIPRSVFVKPSSNKTTFDAGYLVPLYLGEILPGDTVNMRASFFGRLQSLDFPMLDNLFFDTFWFYCPNRILWANWKKFLGEQASPGASIDFSIPILSEDEPGSGTFEPGSLADYMGLPMGDVITTQNISALPFRMYNLVWNEWFRSQELQASLTVPTTDGPDEYHTSGDVAGGIYALRRRGKRHDYFTSATLAPQRGDAVAMPLGDTAPVIGNGTSLGIWDGVNERGALYINATESELRFAEGQQGQAAGTTPNPNASDQTALFGVSNIASQSGLIADLSEAVSATINDMREAIAIQQILERDARMGTRYTERIWGQFRVVVPDFTAQRPEYLGGSINKVGVLQVAQTTAQPASPTQKDARGSLGAYAQVQAQSGFVRSFAEHGYIMCLGSLRADLTYQEKIDRHWIRETRYDFYEPLLAHLGEQAVLVKELFWSSGGTPDAVFGYQERWAEYRYDISKVTGKFRSVASGTLENWHLALEFSSQPALNSTFIEDNPPMARVLAVDTEPHVMMDCYFLNRHARPMPTYSIPGLERL